MGIEEPVISGATKGAGFFLSPVGKANLYITAGFFIVLIVLGLVESVEQHSLYPLADRTIIKVIGADTQIGQQVDKIESEARPARGSSIFSKQFPVWLWFWLKFWFSIIASLWFIYFFCWALYMGFKSLNNVSLARNIVLTAITFIIISVIVGMIMFSLSLAGSCVPNDKAKVFNAQVSNAVPLHGTWKLLTHFLNKDLFRKVDAFASSPFGQMVTNIPNASLNTSVLNVSFNQSSNISNLSNVGLLP